jgi:aminoglycoside phosphotransferase (APT) family kinase protein
MCRPPVGTDERHVRETLLPVLADVCAEAGLDHEGATLLRYVGNAVFRLRAHPVVVRIVLAPALRHRVAKVVAVARWLAECGVPAVRLLQGIAQPVRAGDHLATLWHDVPPTGPPPTGVDLARLLRRFHELPPPAFELPPWEPMTIVRARLRGAEDVGPADRAFLERRCDEVEAALATLEYRLPIGPVHGDAYLGNLIPGPDGPVLCDFDSTCVGPREWDLTPMAVGRLRLGHPPEQYHRFAERYGFDVTSWPGFGVLRQVRELKMVAGALPVLGGNPLVKAEFARRIQSLRDGVDGGGWMPYR